MSPLTHSGGPVLRDGVALADLIDLDARTVAARVLADPEVHDLELDRIFGACWQFVAHECELPKRGDFVTRTLGNDPVIVTRDATGSFSVLLNMCSHKGARVCRAASGSAGNLTCPYHGWIYDHAGGLTTVFAEEMLFPDRPLDKASMGLRRARVGTYRGFIFATWSDTAPSLDEYLGDFRWYLDLVFGAIPGGVELIGPPVRWIVGVNWKVAAENLSGDSYHIATTHRSLFEIGLTTEGVGSGGPVEGLRTEFTSVGAFDPVRGHGTLCNGLFGMNTLEAACPRFGIAPQLAGTVRSTLTPDQVEVFQRLPPIVGNVFPNFSFLSAPFPTELEGPTEPMLCVRVWVPRDAWSTEIMTWPVVYRDTSPELKEAVRRCAIRTFNTTGSFEQDDTDIWATIGRNVTGRQARDRHLQLQATAPASDRWPGPLEAHPAIFSEDNQWNFYRTWYRLLQGPATEVAT